MKGKTAPVVDTWVGKSPLIAKIKSALEAQ